MLKRKKKKNKENKQESEKTTFDRLPYFDWLKVLGLKGHTTLSRKYFAYLV